MKERPSEFTLDEYTYELAEVEDRWYEPEAIYFRVRTTEGKRYILRYDQSQDEWSSQSGFDAEELLAPRCSCRLEGTVLGHREDLRCNLRSRTRTPTSEELSWKRRSLDNITLGTTVRHAVNMNGVVARLAAT